MTHHTPEEKRVNPRVRASFHLHLVYDDLDQLAESYTHDISEGGIFVQTDNPLPVGSRVQLKISIVHQELQYIEAVGEVVHSNEKNGSDPAAGMGIRFVEIDEDSRQFIKDFVVSSLPEKPASEAVADKKKPAGKPKKTGGAPKIVKPAKSKKSGRGK